MKIVDSEIAGTPHLGALIIRRFAEKNIHTLEELGELTYFEVLRTKDIGRKCLNLIVNTLKKLDIKCSMLGTDPESIRIEKEHKKSLNKLIARLKRNKTKNNLFSVYKDYEHEWGRGPDHRKILKYLRDHKIYTVSDYLSVPDDKINYLNGRWFYLADHMDYAMRHYVRNVFSKGEPIWSYF